MDEFLFLSLWAITTFQCLRLIALGLLDGERIIQWPFLAGALSLYFFSIMAIIAYRDLQHILAIDVAIRGQAVAIACLFAIEIGWNLVKHRDTNSTSKRSYSSLTVWILSSMLIVGAAISHYLFQDAIAKAESGVNYENSSAYWYLAFYAGYPGLALSLWSLGSMEKAKRRILLYISLIIFAAFLFPHIYNARRGPLFPAVIILLFVPSFTNRTRPNGAFVLGVLFCTGIAMLSFVEARRFVYNQKTWNDAFDSMQINDVFNAKLVAVSDNEYLNHCFTVATLLDNSKFQYGSGHAELLVHWIPRSLWESKPILGEGYYPTRELNQDIAKYSGIVLLGNGASCGGFAESFVQYGLLTPFFWLLISFVFSLQFSRARYSSDPAEIVKYMALPCASLWLISQGFAAAFVPAAVFFSLPLVVLFIARK